MLEVVGGSFVLDVAEGSNALDVMECSLMLEVVVGSTVLFVSTHSCRWSQFLPVNNSTGSDKSDGSVVRKSTSTSTL